MPRRRLFKHVLAGQDVLPEIAAVAEIALAGDVGQRRQVRHPVDGICLKQRRHVLRAGQVARYVGIAGVVDDPLPPADADHAVPRLQQLERRGPADHARRAGEQYGVLHARPRSFRSSSRVMNRAPCLWSQRMTFLSFFRFPRRPTRQRKRVTRLRSFGSGSLMSVSSKGWM